MEIVDTICAISTPPGEGGIGIIRVSGQQAHPILRKIFVPGKNRRGFATHRLYLGHVVNPETNDVIDEVFAVFMRAPHTYTREDVGEIHSHGGYATQRNILSLMMKCGARLAEPGEFTKRAFLNGRIDLLQAESVLDVIQSETEEELACAVQQLQGTLSKKISAIKKRITGALTEIEALIDFPEDEIEVNAHALLSALRKTKSEIARLIDSYYVGKAIKEGLEVLITGRTNVGKSSLLNALLLKEKAIVTPLPGTTRDLIEDVIHIHGVKIRIIDSAGIRKPKDIAEKKGVERTKQKMSEADLVVWILNGAEPYSMEDAEIYRTIGNKGKIVVVNKIDLPQMLERNALVSRGLEWMGISALKDIGLDALKDRIHSSLIGKRAKSSKMFITNLRHRDALTDTKAAIDKALECCASNEPREFLAFELREALYHLGKITGDTCPEEILHEIFKRFCIGK